MTSPVAAKTHSRWGQVAIATLAQNLATGLTCGSFGTMILAIERDYGASRSQSSLALSLAVVTLSLTGMLVGRILDRVNLRNLMLVGALLCAAGFSAAALARTPTDLLMAYALLVGPGTAMLGVLPSMTLANRWAPEAMRGRALGFVNMPIMVMTVPLVIAPMLASLGPRYIYGLLAMADIAMLPLLLLVRNGASVAPAHGRVDVSARVILQSPAFWVLSVAVGLITGAGTMKLAHFIPLLVGQGRSFAEANMLLALSGGAGLAGSLAFGWLADRIGGPRALAFNAAIQAIVFMIFLAPVTLPVLMLDAIIVGACGGGVQGAFGVAVVTFFGARAFGRAYSLFQLSTLPFLFGLTPLASVLFERSGSYYLPMAVTIACLAISSLALFAAAHQVPPSHSVGD